VVGMKVDHGVAQEERIQVMNESIQM
jgi:hypothetical protein